MPLTNLAETLYEAGDYSGSLILYIFAGELGYQVAQTNAAWLLDQGKISSADYPRVFTVNTTEKDRYKLAHPLWNRAANQGNVDARVKLGDYYYNECLGQDLNLSQRYEKAAEYYKLAADHEFSAIAMYFFLIEK
jgi:SEL1 protein